jgi:hypothetical protein
LIKSTVLSHNVKARNSHSRAISLVAVAQPTIVDGKCSVWSVLATAIL